MTISREFAFAQATLAEVPKLNVDEELSRRLEISDPRKSLLTKTKADAIPHLDRTDPFNRPNETVVRRVLLPQRRAGEIRVESLAKFSHQKAFGLALVSFSAPNTRTEVQIYE